MADRLLSAMGHQPPVAIVVLDRPLPGLAPPFRRERQSIEFEYDFAFRTALNKAVERVDVVVHREHLGDVGFQLAGRVAR